MLDSWTEKNVNVEGLDLSIEVLWVSVGQKQSYGLSHFEDDPIIWDSNLGRPHVVHGRPRGRIFFRTSNFDAF